MRRSGRYEDVRGFTPCRLKHSGSTALASRLLGLRNLLHPMRSMDAASNSATRPMGEPHSFGKCGTRTSVQVVGQALKPRRNEREYRP